jgi:hypothetical protein
LEEFVACLEGLKDPRTGNAGLHDLLMIALCAVLSGGQGAMHVAVFAVAKEPLLQGFLALENGLPSHDTFSRLFRLRTCHARRPNRLYFRKLIRPSHSTIF